jgi:RNA polymerase sigma-70 factor (ECF subfamily)
MDATHPDEPLQPAGIPSARFDTTHWSDVLAAGDSSSPRGQAALAALCNAYWYPLYAYVRGCGLRPEDAKDITQAFFARLMEREFIGAADRERGRFRWFLLKSLQNFLRNEMNRANALKRGGGTPHLSWDALEAEQRYAAEPRDYTTPDLLFDRRWARAAMGRALKRLSDEFTASGRASLFEMLKQYLAGNASGRSYGQVASQLGLSTVAVKVTVHRLRQRYSELLRFEIAQTVADPADINDELRHLAQLLAE